MWRAPHHPLALAGYVAVMAAVVAAQGLPAAALAQMPGDVDGDNVVTAADVALFRDAWRTAKAGGAVDPKADFDKNDLLDHRDAQTLVEGFLVPTMGITGFVSLPVGSPVREDSLVVSTALQQGQPVQTQGVGGVQTAGTQYAFTVKVSKNYAGLVVACKADGTPWLCAISAGAATQSVNLDADSTAAALAFLCPPLTVVDREAAGTFLAQITASQFFLALRDAVAAQLAAGVSPLTAPSATVLSAKANLVTALVASALTVGPAAAINIDPQTANGITVRPNGTATAVGGTATVPLKVLNAKFRYLSLYVTPFDVDGNATRSTYLQPGYTLSSSAIALSNKWSVLASILGGRGTQSSAAVTISGAATDAAYRLQFYGPGKGAAAGSSEARTAELLTLAFDFVAPLVSCIVETDAFTDEAARQTILAALMATVNANATWVGHATALMAALESGDNPAAAAAAADMGTTLFEYMLNDPGGRAMIQAVAALAGRSVAETFLQDLSVWMGIVNLLAGATDALRCLTDVAGSDALTTFMVRITGDVGVIIEGVRQSALPPPRDFLHLPLPRSALGAAGWPTAAILAGRG